MITASLPISSQVGAIAVSKMSAADTNSRETSYIPNASRISSLASFSFLQRLKKKP
ncbi:MAG: hypothetical protein V7K54_02605 [Nostoc sp.]